MNVHPSRLSPPRQSDGEDSFAKAERMMSIAQQNGLHRFEWIHTKADGSDFVAEVTLSSVQLSSRQIIYCVWRDITERKQAEAQLRLAANVMLSTSEGVVVTDANGTILSVNPAFSQITGYEATDAVGRRSNLLKSDHHDASFYQDLWAKLSAAGQWEGEIWNRRKNGAVYLEWLRINRIPANESTPLRYVGVFHDVTEQRQADERIRHLAFHDALTGLPNRALFHDRLEHAIERGRRESGRLAVIFMDLDGFKSVNDSLGHDIGDLLLTEIAVRIRNRIRRGTDTVARLGGDEFVILMEDLKEPEHCATLAGDLIEDISLPMSLREHNIQLSASLGISFFPDDGSDAIDLMRRADAAMYSAKAAGKGTYHFFQSGMLDDINRRLSLEAELRQAIARNTLALYYQPKVCLTDGRVVGVEALLRWPHSQRGMIMPADFVPLAEESGLILPLGDWVLDAACRQAADWRAQGLQIAVAVNVSTRQLTKGHLTPRVAELLTKYQLPGTALQVEVTESAFMSNLDVAISTLNGLRDLGVAIAVDDFGTGYSSLAMLSSLPIDLVKVDRSFVWNTDRHPKDTAVVKTVIALANALGLDVVAEGVETERQAQMLREAGCSVCQGYLFSHPMPPERLLEWMDGIQ